MRPVKPGQVLPAEPVMVVVRLIPPGRLVWRLWAMCRQLARRRVVYGCSRP